MRWRKLGRVYVARGERPWARTHAYIPTTSVMGDVIRVFCAFLDERKVGRVGYVDVDASDPLRVLAVSERPVLDVGRPGAFDDNGVNPLSVCRLDDGRLRLYYAGWQLGVHVRYFLFMGAAESDDGGESFRRVSEVPVLERGDGELHVRTGGRVCRTPTGWRAWYAGGSDWTERPGELARPRYDLRYAESPDGLRWPATGEVVLSPEGDDEHGFGRPAVLEDGDLLRMWPSVRYLSRGYRLGYAQSRDGRRWERLDHVAGLDVSDRGWDSEMVCMADVQATTHGTYLFYNGNNYGETGFGVAVAD